ncbi:hypothetical protein K474DRAFT_1714238 [Panus rudis PR-1116 ss-1]|nr:hypothetical protein K474DRAFT_1714238 [Panus rudis PR-1116 ss-1]
MTFESNSHAQLDNNTEQHACNADHNNWGQCTIRNTERLTRWQEILSTCFHRLGMWMNGKLWWTTTLDGG